MLPSIFEQLAASDVPFRWIGGFLSSWSLACTQAVCSRISTTFAIFRQKSCRAFFAFPFLSRFFRLSRFSAFPFFPPFPLFRSLKKNKSLCGGDSYETVLRYDDLHNTSIFFYWNTWNIYTRYFVLFTEMHEISYERWTNQRYDMKICHNKS